MTVALRADDVGAAWTVTVGDEVTVVRRAEPAEATVAADAADLYLWLWQRAPDARVEITGNSAAVDGLRDAARV